MLRSTRIVRSMALAAAILIVGTGSAFAQSAGGSSTSSVGEATPRDLIEAFLAETRGDSLENAVRLADPRYPKKSVRGSLARLRAVLDRSVWIDLTTLSRSPEGATGDDLPADVDRIALIQRGGASEPVLIRKLSDDKGGGWVIASSTLDRANSWYESLSDRWLRERLPAWAFTLGPRDLYWWQWIALPVVLVFAWLLARLLFWPTARIVRFFLRKTAVTWDDLLFERLATPVRFALVLLTVLLALPSLLLTVGARLFIERTLSTLFLVTLFWSLLRGMDVVMDEAARSAWIQNRPQSRSFLPFLSRLGKVMIGIVGALTALQQLGYPITGLIAGLGIGGLAIALAAQKTFENLIGSVALSVDQPFQPGDLVKIEDLVGTIEAVGLRSTKVRTLERSLVTIPNGKLADTRIENLSKREKYRFFTTISLVLGTPPETTRALIGKIVELLSRHPNAQNPNEGGVDVRLIRLGTTAQEIDVSAYFSAETPAHFSATRQELLMELLKVVKESGVEVAVPTHRLQAPAGWTEFAGRGTEAKAPAEPRTT